MKKHFLLTLLLFLPGFFYGEQLVRVTARDIATRLIQDGVLICMETVHNQPGDEITLAMQLETLQSIPEGNRTKIERLRLAQCLEMNAAGDSENTIVGWEQRVFDFDYPATIHSVPDILDMLISSDSSYSWTMIGTRYVVFPRFHSFDCKIDAFEGHDLNIDDFMTLGIDKIIRPSNLHYSRIGPVRDWRWKYTDALYSINLPAGQSRVALTLFCNVLGPHFLWQAGGIEPYGITIGISPSSFHKNTTEQGAAANPYPLRGQGLR